MDNNSGVVPQRLVDMVAELRDYCIRQEMPPPVIETVQRSGSEFLATCMVGSIKRYGMWNSLFSLKVAGQLAAIEMLIAIKPLGDDILYELAKRRVMSTTGRKLCDDHNYYKNFLPHLKEAAFEVINSKEYKSDKDQLLALLSALKITPEFSAVPSKGAPLLMVELNVSFDTVFIDFETKIYSYMIGYFKDMLD